MNVMSRAAATACVLVLGAGVAAADQWNDKTKLTFSAPVMVPGATLAAGTYTFKLFDSKANRSTVQIFNEDETKLIATTQSIPAKRMDTSGDVVVRFNPTEAGAPVALKAWFYPGSRYGHEFVYPEEQARQIAQRTKTLVLSGDAAHADGRGTLYTFDAAGNRGDWRMDEAVSAEWEQWNREGRRTAEARVARPATGSPASTAPVVTGSAGKGMEVALGDLEENAAKYLGQDIRVTAEVDEVFGPRLFKIDEQNWADLDGEVLVFLPSGLAALVREGDRVTVSGTLKTLTKVEMDRELEWLNPEPGLEIRLAERPVLMAKTVIGGNDNVALAVEVGPAARSTSAAGAQSGSTSPAQSASASGSESGAVGTSGSSDTVSHSAGEKASAGTTSTGTSGASTPVLTDVAAIARGDDALVGRRVNVRAVMVDRVEDQGFWVKTNGPSVFVKHVGGDATVKANQSVSIEGVVLQMPRTRRTKVPAGANDEIYVQASALR